MFIFPSLDVQLTLEFGTKNLCSIHTFNIFAGSQFMMSVYSVLFISRSDYIWNWRADTMITFSLYNSSLKILQYLIMVTQKNKKLIINEWSLSYDIIRVINTSLLPNKKSRKLCMWSSRNSNFQHVIKLPQYLWGKNGWAVELLCRLLIWSLTVIFPVMLKPVIARLVWGEAGQN